MTDSNRSSRESKFFGTIDQLIGYNVADLRAQANLSQTDIATIFERVTGREHSRNWLSLRETGQQPFTVAELLILSVIFEVPVVRLLRIDNLDGIVYVDGITKPVRRFHYDFFIDPEEGVLDLVEKDTSSLPDRGGELKGVAEHLRATRDYWLPRVAEMNRKWGQTIRESHEPHPGAGKRYMAWKRKRVERQEEVEEFLRQAKGEEDGNDQED